MKKTIISLVALCSIGLCCLAGCESGSSSVGSGFAISNKDELQEEWHVNDSTRQIEFTCDDEEFNVSALISSGDLIVESSNTDVVSVVGTYLYPMSVGAATIKATYGKKSDSVDVTISEYKTNIPYEVGQQYYLGVDTTGSGDWKYVDGGTVSGRDYEGTMTSSLTEAALVTLESDDKGEGFYLSFTLSEVKYYIGIYSVGGYMDLQYTTTATSLYWSDDYDCFANAENTHYLGYYATYDCSYACEWKYWGSSEPPLVLVNPDEAIESHWEVPAEETVYVESITSGSTYYLGLYSDYNRNTYGTYYFTGSIANQYYGATSQDLDSAVVVTVTQGSDTNKWKLSFTSAESATYYIGLAVSTSSGSTHYNFTLVGDNDQSGATTEFEWDTTYHCFKATVNTTTRFLGSYGSYTTFGWYSYSSISSAHEYPGRLYATTQAEEA